MAGKKGRGRPLTFTQAKCDEICARMANGESLREICRSEEMPPESTVRRWVTEDHAGFSAQYTRAREAQAERWAEEIVEIADDGTNDWIERQQEGGEPITAVDHEHIQRSRLRVETRKWLLSKLLPKRYGEKLQTELTGKDGGPIELSLEARRKEARAILENFGASTPKE